MTDVPIETSLMRTYRYVRLGIAATVVVIAVAIGFAFADVGLLPSISAYYYTSARDAFVGAIVASAFGLFAISGRGVERNLLDAAALLAPLIALVPSPVQAGGVAALSMTCPGDSACIPLKYLPGVANGVMTYLTVGVILIVVALLVRRSQGLAWRQIAASVVISAGVLALVAAAWVWARDSFLTYGHFAAASLFFLVIAAVAVWNAFPHAGDPLWVRPSRRLSITYIAIAVLMVADIAAITIVVAMGGFPDAAIPPVFVLEFVALALFVAFWVLQSVQKWHDPDPSILGPRSVGTRGDRVAE